MFQEWGFLLAEIWGLLALSALVGLIAGWLIRGHGRAAPDTALDALATRTAEVARLRTELDACIAARKAEAIRTVPPAIAPTGPVGPVRPLSLTAARNGRADDLKLIKGIGPKLEILCHQLGFFHFDQIAAWTPAELEWVDEHLDGFRGRATRDNWTAQARALALGAGN